MTSEDFKQALRAGNLSQAFLLAMSKAPELHITTWIASPQDRPAQPQPDKTLRTHINLVEGKIDNEIGEQLLSDRYPEIQQFHHQQVTQGHQTIQQNLQSLQQMFRLMATFQKQQQNPSQSSWIDVSAAKPTELEGQTTDKAIASSETVTESLPGNKAEPQLPSFATEAEEDAVVDDLLSLADLDDDEEPEAAVEEDWGDWLEEDDSPKNPEIMNLNSTNSQKPPHEPE